jgi:hypothetical protein
LGLAHFNEFKFSQRIEIMRSFSLFMNEVVKVIFLALLSLSGSNSHAQQATEMAAKVSPKVAAPVTVPVQGLLFEIKSGKQTAYLFGSIHIAKADFYPMSPKVEEVYKSADTVAVEADVTNAAAVQTMMPKLMYSAPDKLEAHLKATTWADLSGIVGPMAQQLQVLRPAAVVSAFTVEIAKALGYSPEKGIDVHYIQRAKADQKAVVELESLQFQADVLGGLSDEEGDAMVASLVDSIKQKKLKQELDDLVGAWRGADAARIAKLFDESANRDAASKKMTKMLLDDRNEGMVIKINQMMGEGKKLFVVVGAGHLAGEKSVIDLLQKQGLQVTQIR